MRQKRACRKSAARRRPGCTLTRSSRGSDNLRRGDNIGPIGGGMRLTAAGKFLLFVVGLGILGYAAWPYRHQLAARIPGRSTATTPTASTTTAPAPAAERKGVLAN